MPDKQQQFYDALTEVFVGAKIEGDSGYINLMQIKSRYFRDKVFPKLQEEIEAVLEKHGEFRDELFDKLYDFFHRYFSESGSIYFRRTRYPQSVYERVYTDDRDVILFWKTHMLYYVKTERLFNTMEIEVDEQAFIFDVANLEHKQANEKRELVYRFGDVREDGAIVLNVEYSSHGSKTKVLDILKALRGVEVELTEDTLDRACRVFEKQSEVDYFINKDAERFLKEQFDLWLYRYVFEGQNVWLQRRLEQLQSLKDIAYKIIDFIAQFEDELVRIWNKPKFVRNSHYIITLDRIAERDRELLERILDSDGIEAQIAEWRDLGMVQAGFQAADVWVEDLVGTRLSERYQYLPLDTEHVRTFESDILSLFDQLDMELDGWLIKSENYQALETLRDRFGGQVNCVYIDPPYNTSDESFLYRNDYKHASWISMMQNRIRLIAERMTEDAVIQVAIDDTEIAHLRLLLDQVFGSDNRIATLAIEVNPAGQNIRPNVPALSHDYCLVYGRDIAESEMSLRELTAEEMAAYSEADNLGRFYWDNLRRRGGNSRPADRPNQWYPIYIDGAQGIVSIDPFEGATQVWPVDPKGEKRIWRMHPSSARRAIAKGEISVIEVADRFEVVKKTRMPEGRKPKTLWTDSIYSATTYGTKLLNDIVKNAPFSYPKSVHLVRDCIRYWTHEDATVLDFFGGSGTTAHAVMNLNRQDNGRRKYILVEMGDYFKTVILPRVKKIAFSDSWKNGVAGADGEGMSQFVKYYELEQYEDVLRRARYGADGAPFDNPYEDTFSEYVFLRDLKMLDALEVDHEAGQVDLDLTKLYDDIDLPETLANLRGKAIARIGADYVVFEDGERIDLENLDWQMIKPLIWW